MGTEPPDGFERKALFRAVLTAIAATTVDLATYYLAPLQEQHESAFVMVAIGVGLIAPPDPPRHSIEGVISMA